MALVLLFMYNIAPRHLTLLCVLLLAALAAEDAPRAVVDNMLGKGFGLVDATNRIINDAEPAIINELDIVPVKEHGDIDEESLEVFDATKNIFNPIQIEDYTGFTADQKASMEERAIDEGLLTAASERARTVVEEFLSAFPGAEEYTIRVS